MLMEVKKNNDRRVWIFLKRRRSFWKSWPLSWTVWHVLQEMLSKFMDSFPLKNFAVYKVLWHDTDRDPKSLLFFVTGRSSRQFHRRGLTHGQAFTGGGLTIWDGHPDNPDATRYPMGWVHVILIICLASSESDCVRRRIGIGNLYIRMMVYCIEETK